MLTQVAELTFAEVRAHMAAYLASGDRARKVWTVCLPAHDLQGRNWRELLMQHWLDARAAAKALDLRLAYEDIAVVGTDRVLVLVGVRRKARAR